MINKKQLPGLGLLLLLFAILACNLPRVSGGGTNFSDATLTPPPTSEFVIADSPPDPEFFVEEFDLSFPENWTASPGWSVQGGILSTGTEDTVLEIPGEWQDLSLFSRIKFTSEYLILQFNRSEAGAYAIILTREGISLVWQPNGGEFELLSFTQAEIDTGWHDLLARLTHGKIELLLDNEPLLKHFNLGLSPSGSIALAKTGIGQLEIDRIVLAPAGMGFGSAAPTPAPVQPNLDLALVEVSVTESGELVVWMVNNGPDPTLGHAFGLMITVAGDKPALAIFRDPLQIYIDQEWATLFPVETGILVDSNHAGQQLTVSFQAFNFHDPDLSNNQLDQTVPIIPK